MRAAGLGVWLMALAWALALPAVAQEAGPAYLQVEAQPTRAQAEAAAARYAATFEAVVGYDLGTGWYAIALGPYADRTAAEAAGRSLRAAGRIPFDAFVVEAARTAARIWPGDGAGPLPTAGTALRPVPEPEAATPPAEVVVEETPAEARRSEAQLDRAARAEIQTALAWFGHYDQAIDASFGPATRRAMTAWQEAEGIAPTGVLTTRQRDALIAGWRAERAAFGFAPWRDEDAGIEITLPRALVALDGVQAPFVRFAPVEDSGVQVLLISQQGTQATLSGLYEILQTLEIVPPEGARERGRDRFTLTGQDARIATHAEAQYRNGQIKGFVLVWPAGQPARRDRALGVMRDSFRTFGPALPDGLGAPASALSGADLVAGLEVRRPARMLTGFFIDDTGRVMTSAAGAEGCARLTIDGHHDAEIYLHDAALGIAVLAPLEPLAPSAVARFAEAPPALRAEVVLAGYGLPEMTGPVLTMGRLAALEGMSGETALHRLTLSAEAGEIGGPILDRSGAVVGMLVPPQADTGRILPEGVSFAASGAAILRLLRSNGVEPGIARPAPATDLPALARAASALTVQVACWN